MNSQSLEVRVIILVLAGLASLFAATTVISGWYHREEHNRARKLFVQGEVLARAGKHEQAIEHFTSALAVARTSTEYRLALARSLMALGRNSEAALNLQDVLRADPSAALPNLLLARIAGSEGRTEAAVGYYHRAIYGYWRQDAPSRRGEARWELIQLLAAAKQEKQVIAELISAADDAPSDSSLQIRVAEMLIEHASPNQSAELLHSLISREPTNVQARTLLGQAEMAMGNYQLARSSFRRALQYEPGYEPARQELAMVSDALSLDPTLPRLNGAQRFRRSAELASRALADVQQCAKDRLLSPEAADLIEQARLSLARRPSDRAQAVEINVALAEALWDERAKVCGNQAGDQAVGRVIARLSR